MVVRGGPATRGKIAVRGTVRSFHTAARVEMVFDRRGVLWKHQDSPGGKETCGRGAGRYGERMKSQKGIAMKKKVLVILGSPRRKGNSAILADRIAQGAKSAKAGVETIFLQGRKIAPCKSCYACQKENSNGCSIRDDMQEIYLKLIEADAWVIASPVYWFTMSAQTKIFMDRCFALGAYRKDAFKGKRIAVAMTYGDRDPMSSGCVNAVRTFQDAFGYTESQIVGMVYGSALDAGRIRSNEAVMEEAFELGKKLVSGDM